LTDIVSGTKGSANDVNAKPYAHSGLLGIMEVALHGEDLTRLHTKPGLLFHLTHQGVSYLFVSLDISTWNAPSLRRDSPKTEENEGRSWP
jgi:hypothetical protein